MRIVIGELEDTEETLYISEWLVEAFSIDLLELDEDTVTAFSSLVVLADHIERQRRGLGTLIDEDLEEHIRIVYLRLAHSIRGIDDISQERPESCEARNEWNRRLCNTILSLHSLLDG